MLVSLEQRRKANETLTDKHLALSVKNHDKGNFKAAARHIEIAGRLMENYPKA